MVKRKTNFRQVYLVDRYMLNLQENHQHSQENPQFSHFRKHDSFNKIGYQPKFLQEQTTPSYPKDMGNDSNLKQVNDINTQTVDYDEISIPNEYFLTDISTQTNGEILKDATTQSDYANNMLNSQSNRKETNDVNIQTDNNEQLYYIQSSIPQLTKSYICQICNQLFDNPKEFSNHLKGHREHIRMQNKSNGKKLKTNSNSKDKKNVNISQHLGDRRPMTPFLKLNKNLSSIKRFADGRNMLDWKNKYLCKICNIKLRTYSSLKSHVDSLHKSKRVKYDFPNNSKYAAVASLDLDMDMIQTNQNNQDMITTSDIEMPEYDRDYTISSNNGALKIRDEINSSSKFEDDSNIMGPTRIRSDIGTQSNFEDYSNIMGPISARNDLANSFRFENNSNIMGPLNVRNDVASTSNIEDNTNIMGPINVRNELGSSSMFEDNSNIMNNTLEENRDKIKDTDEKKIKDVTLVEDLQTYWCTKCEQFFRNFKSLRDNLLTKHKEVAILSKRSKTKEAVKRKIPFYSNYN